MQIMKEELQLLRKEIELLRKEVELLRMDRQPKITHIGIPPYQNPYISPIQPDWITTCDSNGIS